MNDLNTSSEGNLQSNLKYSLFKLNEIPKNEIKFHNLAAYKSRIISFKVDDRILFFRLIPPPEQINDFAEIWIKLLVNQHSFWIGFSKYSFGILLGNCFLIDSLKDQPTEIHSAIVESTLNTLLHTIESSLGFKIEIDAVALQEPDTNPTRNIFFALNQNGRLNANSYLAFDETLRPFFSKFLEKLPDSKFHNWDLLQTSIRFQIGSTRLNVKDLQDLNCNDLIFIDDCPLLHDHLLTVCIAPNLVCKGIHKDNKLVIQTTLSEKMKEQENNVIDIDELQINLAFDVGEHAIQFQELKKIQPGYIFELDNLVTRPVTIRANGQSIGSGELLQTDEKIAVRVLELNQKSYG